MSKYLLAFVIATAAAAGCGDVPEPLVIPGPTAPGRVTTDQPLVWDSREELLDWVANAVTRGPITVEGDGAAAFIRVRLDVNDYVMRGPDLVPPAAGVRGARVRARLRHDRSRSPQAVQTEEVHLYFEVIDPPVANAQSSMRVSVPPARSGWTSSSSPLCTAVCSHSQSDMPTFLSAIHRPPRWRSTVSS